MPCVRYHPVTPERSEMNLARLMFSSMCAGTLICCSAFAQDGADRFYQAIRNDDLGLLRTMAGAASINSADRHGTTPLMDAAAIGSTDTVKLLLDRGADPNAKNAFGATPLMWAAGDIEKVRLLVGKGANVNARSNIGRTPLFIAVLHDGSFEIAKLLIEKGADATARDKLGFTVLEAAAQGNDTATVGLVLAHGGDVKAKDGIGATALMAAATHGNAEVVKLLLAKGGDVNAVTIDFFESVKNGPIALGLFTPLILAVPYGGFDTVKLLVDAGANVNAADTRGMTPLMLAVSCDRPDPRIIRLLRSNGADVTIKSKRGETVSDWANKFRNPEVLEALGMRATTVATDIRVRPVTDAKQLGAKAAVEKSIVLLQRTNSKFVLSGGCIGCHAQNLTGMAVKIASMNGAEVDGKVDADMARSVLLLQGGIEQTLMQLVDPPPGRQGVEYSVLQFGATGLPPSRAIDALLHYLVAAQRKAGNWPYGPIPRSPIEDGDFFGTAMGIRCLQLYSVPARNAEFQDRIQRAGAWLNKAQPRSTEDRVMQLLGLRWVGIPVEQREHELLALQREDGGWAQTPWLSSDGYATGQVLYALHEAGMPASHEAYGRGVQYLARTQQNDGSWHVSSRAPKFQPFFQSGFPYDDDQWISSAATAWAAMGMAYAIPVTNIANARK
jgi:ankyrin repeat protein